LLPWRAIDHKGKVLETVVAVKQDKAAALKPMTLGINHRNQVERAIPSRDASLRLPFFVYSPAYCGTP
jgi:hypothetical protein